MFLTILVAATSAFDNNEWRGQIYETSMVLLALYGYLNGFVTARFLRFYSATDWKFSAVVSACALPIYFVGGTFMDVFFSFIMRSPSRYSAL